MKLTSITIKEPRPEASKNTPWSREPSSPLHVPFQVLDIPTAKSGVQRIVLHTERHGDLTITLDDSVQLDTVKITCAGRIMLIPLAVSTIAVIVDPLRPPDGITQVQDHEPRAEAKAARDKIRDLNVSIALKKAKVEIRRLTEEGPKPLVQETSKS